MQTFWQDIRDGLRVLAKNPGFSAVATLPRTSERKADTAVSRLLNAATLHAIPVRNPKKLVALGCE